MKPASKYHAKAVHCAAGHYHPSTGEGERCNDLGLLQQAGVISMFVDVHPTIELIKGFKYKPDFIYMEGGKRIVEDYKGAMTDRFRIIKNLWPYHGVGILRITCKGKKTIEISGFNPHPPTGNGG